MESYLPILILFVLFLLNIPIAFSLIASAMVYFLFINDSIPVSLVMQRFISSTESFPLLAIPFFIMVGSVMNYAGISKSLLAFADSMIGHKTGGLAQVNVALSTLMGGISGSANADAAMQSKILAPEMTKRGYDLPFTAAVTAASSSISPVIPPGINLIIFALLANVSVHQMFIAGYVPAFLMALSLMVTIAFIARKLRYKPSRSEPASAKERFHYFLKAIPALLIPFGIILGMRFGLFTPTEAGAIAVLLCAIIGIFVYRQLGLRHIPLIMRETVQGTSSVMFIIIGAMVFGYYMTLEQIPHNVASALIELTDNKLLLLLLINVLLLVVGMFIEGGAAMIILTPLLLPAVLNLGVNPVHFGIIVIVNIMIGGVTPPFGSMMFTVCSILKVRMVDFVKEVVPLLLALLSVLMLLTFSESLVMFLPNLL
ncbi:TRAP transporter large permease [Vibrio lentus]|uniref:TRAP transporter large permease protein n=1 Tax=Vibrio lentus TaxID=136468 RepID=A0AB36XR13_9VIBR|nr:TRAP transporter large permease [Vibrio lentus]MCC4836633.1 TRAP transporter large permease [Vibrio lentus]PMI17479.1 C4-dicarboxylate ABC transporter [Vibrio lentus]PMK34505.1 C4-dicarboxylate ABC transporter [Vibrio lentus]PMK48174.1 C4-dicarboxylate ABC transporter [Vibrio lentus]PML34629.1 C4-dicarboxylate ABC transporter [Vibrio lentus]